MRSENQTSLKLPSFSFAKRQGATLLKWEYGKPVIALSEKANPKALVELRRHYNAPITIKHYGTDAYDQLIQRLYEADTESIDSLLGDDTDDLSELVSDLPEPEDLLESQDDAPIIKLINTLLTQGIKQNASDIHIEPFESNLIIRFRVDGVLKEILSLQRNLSPLLVSRIKIMAKLDIAEKRLPQDGRISLRIAGRSVDVRVSTLPAGYGERVVLRLLDKQAGRLDLEQLGMEESTLKNIKQLVNKPHGIILVTGPTGSGKTTTLYAALQQINDKSRNIVTVEDPIEYFIEGIGQTQVNNKIGMNFARGLRAILRQDPDVVMIGEIRDLETAEIAVQAALTGHLVLSTLHTNSAIGAINRLRDMGIEPYLLASSLIGVLAQRLVRVLDPNYRQPYDYKTTSDLTDNDKNKIVTLYRPTNNLPTNHSGYQHRTGIYELITIDDNLRTLIHDGASEQQMLDYLKPISTTIAQDGWSKALAGITSLEEIMRVTRD